MPTKNPRINITFEEPTVEILRDLAKRAHKSIASITKELVLEALDRNEDVYLSKLSENRMVGDKDKKRVSHEDAWK